MSISPDKSFQIPFLCFLCFYFEKIMAAVISVFFSPTIFGVFVIAIIVAILDIRPITRLVMIHCLHSWIYLFEILFGCYLILLIYNEQC